MSRPEVSLQNYEPLYEFYEHYEQNQLFARLGHLILSQMYKPIVTYAEGGAAEEAIRNELDEDRRLALAANHLTKGDQYVLMSLVQREKVFRPFIGNSFMAAKAPLFKNPLLRLVLDEMGGIPVFRMEDVKNQDTEDVEHQDTEDVEHLDSETPSDIEVLQRLAVLRVNDVQIARLIRGRHMGNFPGGTRNREDHTKVQELKKGFAHTVLNAAKIVGVSIAPIGMYYGEPDNYNKLDVPNKHTPNMHIGMPLRVDPALSPEELTSQLELVIQDCVNVAVDAYKDRRAA